MSQLFSVRPNPHPIESEPNILKMQEPVIIVGDIHGQFYDMIHMFEKVVDQRQVPKYLSDITLPVEPNCSFWETTLIEASSPLKSLSFSTLSRYSFLVIVY
jgi:serine/threonine-protein phosphatase 2B catalytic subunit